MMQAIKDAIEFTKLLGTVVWCSVLAPFAALNLPTTKKLKVSLAQRLPRGRYPTMWHCFVDDMTVEQPAQLNIVATPSDDTNAWAPRGAIIGIDLERDVVGYANWSSMENEALFSNMPYAAVLLGLPGLVATIPIWLPINIVWGVVRIVTGMSHHTLSVYLRIRGQLLNEDREIVWRAFKNHHNGVEVAYNDEKRAEMNERIHADRLAASFDSWKDSDTFMHQMMRGECDPTDITSEIQDWKYSHDRPNIKIWEWLGMSEVEFDAWVQHRKTVDELVTARFEAMRNK